MIRKERYKVLSWVMTFLILLSTFIGLNGFERASAESITILSEGFDGALLNGGTTSSATAPSGWTFNTIGAYGSTSTGYFGKSAPAIKFSASTSKVTTKNFNLNAPATLSFWLRGASTNADSHLLVEKFDGSNWSNVEDIKPLPTDAQTKSYKLESNIVQIRFSYTKSGGNAALDDVTIIQDAATPSPISVTGVKLDKATLNLTKGQTANLVTTVEPADATNKNVTWSTDKSTVADVDQTGKVTAASAGTANITVTTADGSKKAQCAVTVVDNQVPVEDIMLISSSATMLPGEKIQLFASVLPENATNRNLTWSLDEAGKAFVDVDSNGLVTAKAIGEAVITVRSSDGEVEKKFAVKVAEERSMELSKQMDKDGVTFTIKNILYPSDIITVAIYDKNYVLNGMHQLNLLNGVDSFTVGLEDGSYHLVAKSLFSGETLLIDIQVDTKAPEITVSGVEDGKTYNAAVTPVINVDDKETLVICMLDGKSYDGSAIEVEGTHTLIINVTDKAGNTSTKTINFTIDKTAPEIVISGVEEGAFYNTAVTPVITTNEAEAEVAVTLDGNAYSGTAIDVEGAHKLDITAKDKVENTSTKSITFTIDKTKPIITVSGIQNGKIYSAKAQPSVSTNEQANITMSLDGKDYDGSLITALGAHTLVVTARDRAGNTEVVTINFTVASNNASLNIIRVYGKAIEGFDSDKLKYTMEVSGALTSIPMITAESASSNSKVEVTPALTLPGTTKITVTAEDGVTQKAYEVEFKVPVVITNKTAAVEFTKGSTGEVTINALNTTTIDKEVTLSVGLYDEKNRMAKYVTKYIKLAPGANADLTAAIDIPSDGHTYKVKVLVWDTIENMYPLAKQTIIPVK